MPIVYKKTNSDWGVTALYEGSQLVFSNAVKEPAGILASFFKKNSQKNKNNIIRQIDLYGLFSPSAKKAWANAYKLAGQRKREICVEDIFLALLKEPSVKNLLVRMKVRREAAETLLNNYLKLKSPSGQETVKIIPFEAFTLSLKLHNHKIGSLMLLGALLKAAPQDNILQAIFSNIGLTLDKLEIFAVWILNLNYEFPKKSESSKILYCLRQAQGLEEHFGYFFEYPAIEAAVELSQGQTLTDLQHKKALQYLVKAAGVAKQKGVKVISANFVRHAVV